MPNSPVKRRVYHWKDILPIALASRQVVDELVRKIARAHKAGATCSEIGAALNLSEQRVWQMSKAGNSRHKSPVESYFSEPLVAEVIKGVPNSYEALVHRRKDGGRTR